MTDYVLVIDDDDDIRELLRNILHGLGLSVRMARSGQEALMHIRRHQPALILTDLCMPDITGWDILDVIRKDSRLGSVPTIVVTTLPITQQLASSLRLPMAHILQKHRSIIEIRTRVREIYMKSMHRKRHDQPAGTESGQ